MSENEEEGDSSSHEERKKERKEGCVCQVGDNSWGSNYYLDLARLLAEEVRRKDTVEEPKETCRNVLNTI